MSGENTANIEIGLYILLKIQNEGVIELIIRIVEIDKETLTFQLLCLS